MNKNLIIGLVTLGIIGTGVGIFLYRKNKSSKIDKAIDDFSSAEFVDEFSKNFVKYKIKEAVKSKYITGDDVIKVSALMNKVKKEGNEKSMTSSEKALAKKWSEALRKVKKNKFDLVGVKDGYAYISVFSRKTPIKVQLSKDLATNFGGDLQEYSADMQQENPNSLVVQVKQNNATIMSWGYDKKTGKISPFFS